ncbi:unnamed protein product [Prorocentrum cordatum]|uniref:DUF4200 domain-containing protein n=1 Tax=Prorocentrum cordatum TaxID=2364126 RepID=A0ABN9TKM4_9DINO|nr:unnamed protein product [Polarella glacialis]
MWQGRGQKRCIRRIMREDAGGLGWRMSVLTGLVDWLLASAKLGRNAGADKPLPDKHSLMHLLSPFHPRRRYPSRPDSRGFGREPPDQGKGAGVVVASRVKCREGPDSCASHIFARRCAPSHSPPASRTCSGSLSQNVVQGRVHLRVPLAASVLDEPILAVVVTPSPFRSARKATMEAEMPSSRHPQQLFFDNVSPATRLLEKRRQMYEVQDALETHKARFAKEEEQFKKKEEQLRSKDLQLQHQLFRFNKFLQDNEAKRRRAETRASEEVAQIKLKDEEIDELERQLEESQLECMSLEQDVDKNTKYEEFLERVKETDADNYQRYPGPGDPI